MMCLARPVDNNLEGKILCGQHVSIEHSLLVLEHRTHSCVPKQNR